MSTRIHIALFMAVAALGCGGLSNEDLLFDSALPDDTLQVAPPQDSGTTAVASGRWALETNLALTASGRLNLFVDEVLNHVAAFRARAPDVRTTGHREWKAIRIASTGLFARMTMDLVSDVTCDVSAAPLAADAPQYRWTIEVSAERDSGFVGVMTGESRGVDFADSCGDLSLNVEAARTAGITFADAAVNPVISMAETWQRSGNQLLVTLSVHTNGAAESYLDGYLEYVFQRTATGGGLFQFSIRDNVRDNGVEHLLTVLQWDTDGRPWRSDFCIDATAGNTCGTACGPRPLIRTYLTDTADGVVEGTPSACGDLAYVDPNAPAD